MTVELEIGHPSRPLLCLPFGGEKPCAGEDVIQCRAGSKMRRVRWNAGRQGDSDEA
jgi:hypothetical protein